MHQPAVVKLSDGLQPARRHLAAGEIEAARALLRQGVPRWPENGSLRLLAAQIAEAEGHANEAAGGAAARRSWLSSCRGGRYGSAR